jgi:hypothetical protein
VAEHVLQGELPPTGVTSPSALFEEQAKEEKTLSALLWHRGQEAASFDWLRGRSRSNLHLQAGQKYS